MRGALASWQSGRGLLAPLRLVSHPCRFEVRSIAPWRGRGFALSGPQATAGSECQPAGARLYEHLAHPGKGWPRETLAACCRCAMPEVFPWARKSEDGDEYRSESPRRHQKGSVLFFGRRSNVFWRCCDEWQGGGLGDVNWGGRTAIRRPARGTRGRSWLGWRKSANKLRGRGPRSCREQT